MVFGEFYVINVTFVEIFNGIIERMQEKHTYIYICLFLYIKICMTATASNTMKNMYGSRWGISIVVSLHLHTETGSIVTCVEG